MKPLSIFLATVATLGIGCRATTPEPSTKVADAAIEEQLASASREVNLASFQQTGGSTPDSDARPEVLSQPASIAAQPEALPAGEIEGLTIDTLQQMALASNPAVGQAAARVEALRGQWVQAGLPPNPEVGYMGSELGNDGRGGQNGGYAGQEFITGNKLGLSQAVVAGEIHQAEQQLYATQVRVRTDVRQACYAVLIAQRRVELSGELLRLSGAAVQASQELRKAEEIPTAGVLQTEVEQQNALILQQNARNELTAAWQRLTAVVGADMPLQHLAGDVATLPGALDWDTELARVTAASPELGAAMADIARAQAALQRARVEPIPNLLTQASVQYDDNSNYTIGGLQAGVPLPLWNRNQGGIRQAQAEIAEARRNADRVELDLKRRLADAYRDYATARNQAETYSGGILPKAQQTLDLVQRGFQLGEVGYLDLLTAQRTYFQTNLAYLDSLAVLWSRWAEIDGLLLTGSLDGRPQ